jgi:ferritin-like metal-binding protein YciE
METPQLKELLLQSLEHERGGVKIYETALKCAQNEDLREEWEKYLEQTRNHVRVLTDVCETLGLDPKEKTPGAKILHDMGASLVAAMEEALQAGEPQAAQIVACECVVLAETKDHLDWELIGVAAKNLKAEEAKTLKEAYEEVEDEEDEHLYHTRGWCRELWLQSLGIKAVLPPPEEKRHVKTAIAAARTEKARTEKARTKAH